MESKNLTEIDETLVERARNGDTEAFGELFEQHRSHLHGWAARMTGDTYMADDIVQDAFVKAFLHVGSLADTSRFLPWLYRIARNQANMRLRRGGPHRKESPFVSMQSGSNGSSKVDWEDLDSILYHLARKASEATLKDQDPAESLLRKELYETIHALLHCLSTKERGIFKAYFFRQLTPEAIAAMYEMTTGSVYTYIYRTRQKLRKEHARVSLSLMPEQKGGGGMLKSKRLQLPDWTAQPSLKTSLVDSVGRMLALLNDRRDTEKLMGMSTIAFRMKISDRTTFADSIYIFDWKQTLHDWFEKLGYRISVLSGQLSNSPVPVLGAVERFPVVLPIEEAVIPFIRKYINLGQPVLYFDTLVSGPYVHEWSMIYGYDDERRTVCLTDPMAPEGKELSYEDVVNNPVRFLAGIDGVIFHEAMPRQTEETANRAYAEQAVRFAVSYARSGCGYRPTTSYLQYTSGLHAYDRWIGYLRERHHLPNRYGMGHLLAYYAEIKRYASIYLRSVPFRTEAMRLTLLAAEAYEQAAEEFDNLCGDVPFIRTSEMLSEEMRARCAASLSKAKEFESAAIGFLERAITHMK
ncbi:RNA polymerase sigma factor [Paenibacillus sp. LHD-117]|uniref:RNA polymerase sigma factor n=1 Tax=Paenibacillus sp. LHD-117 TaxID=3071412 RepID=UPI0027E063A2|nr:RNA polymerase sigma factor [Paenibacillus sp. LHD-117]MDQ6421260.1 RNA polymerase sigma factor [Paenibacillus sp. LHD-117]